MLPGAFRNSCLLELHDIFVPHNSEDFHLAESTLVLVLGPQRESPLLHGTSDIVHEYPWGFPAFPPTSKGCACNSTTGVGGGINDR